MNKSTSTFGSNIYKMFLDSFFLDETGLMGEFAHKKINNTVKKLIDKQISIKDLEKEKKIIDYISDDLLHDRLLQMYNKKLKN